MTTQRLISMKDGTYQPGFYRDGTFGLKTQVGMGKGYWVSEPHGVTIEGGVTPSAISDALSLLDAEQGEYIGLWTDTETGIVYLDRSHHFYKLDTALDLAKHWEQIAIWDCSAKEEIRVA
jgi:hypothetical protein